MDKLFSSMSETAQASVVPIAVTVAVMLFGPYALRLVYRLFFPQSAPHPNTTTTVTGKKNLVLHAVGDAAGHDIHKPVTFNPGMYHQHDTTYVSNKSKGGISAKHVEGVTLNNNFSGGESKK